MFKITFLGAGSMVFAKSILGDCMNNRNLSEIGFEIALYDIDLARLDCTYSMLENMKRNEKVENVKIIKYTNRRDSLRDANYIVNAIQVGGYMPCTVTDFEVPKKYGLRQTIADTVGIGGIFRALRTMPVLDGFAEDIKAVCPKALFINYTNPMGMLTGYMIKHLELNAIGLCHSVQGCVRGLFEKLGLQDLTKTVKWKIAGINHLGWLYSLTDENDNDIYPFVKQRSHELRYDKDGNFNPQESVKNDLVRLDMMEKFGYYKSEGSIHTAEYNPYYIKRYYPELIEKYNISLDEYIKRCITSNNEWDERVKSLAEDKKITHTPSSEYASNIILACETDKPFKVHGNVINNGLITNLSQDACVEVPCLIDRNGVNPVHVGRLPEVCAALTNTHINVQLLTIKAGITRRKEDIYHAAFLDPHTSAELSLDDIKSMCDDLIKEHGSWLPEFK